MKSICIQPNTDLYLFTDKCPSRNKNRFIVEMISVAVRKCKKLNSVTLIFLERGHTQNENDTIHAAIERNKKGLTINHPFQCLTLIESACKKSPLIVKAMECEDFFNFITTCCEEAMKF